MNTPVCDFVREYAEKDALRLHMPGHKGKSFLGCEKYDITEIGGADSLFEADGILLESERNAAKLFGAERTFFSAEGSSLCIRAMLYLAVLYARENGRKPLILAGRNAHKAFVSAAGILDFSVGWLYPSENESYLSCTVGAKRLDEILEKEKPCAVYLTSPDYLGGLCDIGALSAVCKKHGALLLIDNAHGAYRKFLPVSQHPLDLGADLCCDSAHKTLPVLTGGAYLHVARSASDFFVQNGKKAMALFASTSPSYLVLQSLDAANRYLADGYRERLAAFIEKLSQMKKRLSESFDVCESEELKLTVRTKPYGFTGTEFAERLREKGVEIEFADPDYAVMMFTPGTGEDGLIRLEEAMRSVPKKTPLTDRPPHTPPAVRAYSVREAIFSPSETVSAENSLGRVLAGMNVGCPPAVPIAVCGEIIDESAVEAFKYYSIDKCEVLK